MLNLIDLLKIKGIFLENYKIHLATRSRSNPLDEYIAGNFKEWQDQQNHKNFQCDFILSLISMENDKWLFVGVFKVLA